MQYLNYYGEDVTVTSYGEVRFPFLGSTPIMEIDHTLASRVSSSNEVEVKPSDVAEFVVRTAVPSLPLCSGTTYIVPLGVFISCRRRDFVTPFRLKDGRCSGFVRHP